jgi:hypothetical protein
MYKQCDRCRFNVPVKNTLCHVCGSKSFIEMRQASANYSLQAMASVGANVGNGVKDGVGQLCGQLRDMAGTYAREFCDVGGKAKSAAAKMKSMVVASGPSHDELLSFHKSIRRETLEDIREAVPVVREAAPVVREAVPVVREAAPVVREAAPVVREATPVASVQSLPSELMATPPLELEGALKADVETLKQNLDELKNWFENYGRESTILAKSVQADLSNRQAA